jgi:hypothetical protein
MGFEHYRNNLDIDGLLISDNSAGMHIDEINSIIKNSIIKNSQSFGLEIERFTNSKFENVIIENNNGSGVILLDQNDPKTIANIHVRNNKGRLGGGIRIGKGDVHFVNVLIENNDSQEGGGIHLEDGLIEFTNTVIKNNFAKSGGGLSCLNGRIFGRNFTVIENKEDDFNCENCRGCPSVNYIK